MSIKPESLGLQVVTTPGTPQPISSVATNGTCKQWTITPTKALPGTANVGNIYIGTSTMSKSTGAGVYRVLTPTTLPVTFSKPESSGEFFKLNEWFVDADNGTDGFLVGFFGQ